MNNCISTKCLTNKNVWKNTQTIEQIKNDEK